MERAQRIKKHIRKYQVVYSCAGTALVVAGITAYIMRSVASQPISVAIGDAACGAVGVAGKKVVMNNVSIISANRQGSPSWVIRCLETDEVFTSQRKAAMAMDIPQPHMSEHLNGIKDHAHGFHFERICMAA